MKPRHLRGCAQLPAEFCPACRQLQNAAALGCSCVVGEGCDAEGDPGCRYCQTADPEIGCPADES